MTPEPLWPFIWRRWGAPQAIDAAEVMTMCSYVVVVEENECAQRYLVLVSLEFQLACKW
jgi:hypothetical protein